MTNELTIARTGALQSRSAQDIGRAQKRAAEITQGIAEGFAKVTYKGGKWGIKHKGNHQLIPRYSQTPSGQMIYDGPEPFLDCVLLDAAERTSKVFYLQKFVENSIQPPDCWSSNGITPDMGAPKKQSATCAGCKWNAWGSRVTTDGTVSRGKECADHKRLAVVPVKDIKNEQYGGPMLLGVPPSSLKNYAQYIKALADLGYEMHEVWTRISFEPTTAHPVFVFDAVGVLDAAQQALVAEVMDDPIIDRILNTEIVGAEGYDEPASATAPAPTPASTPAPTPTPAPTLQGNLPLPPPGLTAAEWAAIQSMRQPVSPPPPPPPPPGVSAEEWAAIQKMRQPATDTIAVDTAGVAQPQPADDVASPPATTTRRRTRRTAQPSPQPHDSSHQSTDPSPSSTLAPSPAQGNGASPDVAATISSAIDKLL
jgi:hypothetical protein